MKYRFSFSTGDAATGKSSIVERFVRNEFHQFLNPTIGAAFLTQNVQVDDRIIRFEIWDTAGRKIILNKN